MASDGTGLTIADRRHAAARQGARRRPSPLAQGIGARLAWAAGLSALLWLAVFWALS
jgi:hypothetical protein